MLYYILERDGEYKIIKIPEDQEPLYEEETWNFCSGPYNSYEEAGGELPDLELYVVNKKEHPSIEEVN